MAKTATTFTPGPRKQTFAEASLKSKSKSKKRQQSTSPDTLAQTLGKREVSNFSELPDIKNQTSMRQTEAAKVTDREAART